jgi:hypothetical protein
VVVLLLIVLLPVVKQLVVLLMVLTCQVPGTAAVEQVLPDTLAALNPETWCCPPLYLWQQQQQRWQRQQ